MYRTSVVSVSAHANEKDICYIYHSIVSIRLQNVVFFALVRGNVPYSPSDEKNFKSGNILKFNSGAH